MHATAKLSRSAARRAAGALLLATLVFAALLGGSARAGTASVTQTVTFNYTGSEQNFVVPTAVTSLHVIATGGSGQTYNSNYGGGGAIVTSDVAVTPAQKLFVVVGGNGRDGGFNGGAAGAAHGGGASELRFCSQTSTMRCFQTEPRAVVAGGGGGAGRDGYSERSGAWGGNGGRPDGSSGTGGSSPPGTTNETSNANGGGGGTGQSAGGAGAGSCYDGGSGHIFCRSAGQSGVGSQGGAGASGAGGGGGGYYGGGGGGEAATQTGGASGGGGSSFGPAQTTYSVAFGQFGPLNNPSVVISYTRTIDVTVALSPAAIKADGTSTATATATVRANEALLTGEQVAITSSDAHQVIGTVRDLGNGRYQATITSSTAHGPSTITATDSSGTPSVAGTATLTQDSAAPTVSIVTPPDRQHYVRGASVNASYSCADEAQGSGLASCTGTVASGSAIDTSTVGDHTFTVTATDNSGNTASQTNHYTVYAPDVTKPTITLTTPPDGQHYSRFQGVTASYACADEAGGSGVATCSGTASNGAAVDTSTLGAHSFTVNATDYAGNASTKTVSYTVDDVTQPGITIAVPVANRHYNQNQAVNASYSCADESGGSGLRTCSGTVANGQPVDTSTLGAHTFTVTASDNAGNLNSKSLTYTVDDVTKPTVSIVTPVDAAHYNQNQVVNASYSCADETNGSGIATCTGPVASGSAIDTSTVGSHAFAVTARDNAGNTLTKTINYTVDDTVAPAITITTPVDGASYAEDQTVAADYTCTDTGGSGVATCVGPVTKGSGINTGTPGQHAFEVDATDSAGNPSQKIVHYTVVANDQTPPTISITTPVDNQHYSRDAVVNASYACSDNSGGSGVLSCAGPVASGDSIDTSTLGEHTFTVTAKDNAQNAATPKTVHYVVDDVTKPTIVITALADHQHFVRNQSVAASYTCADESGGSGLASCSGPVDTGHAIDTSTLGEHTFTVTATDTAGNSDSRSVHYVVDDATKPTIAIASPVEGHHYGQGQAVAAAYTCADESGGSGIQSCTGHVASGGHLDTQAPGGHSFTVVAKDSFGNSASRTVNYVVDPPPCVVPNVKGKSLSAARRALTKAHCALGKVTKKPSSRVKRGKVISQKPGARKILPPASKVALTVSTGPRRKH